MISFRKFPEAVWKLQNKSENVIVSGSELIGLISLRLQFGCPLSHPGFREMGQNSPEN